MDPPPPSWRLIPHDNPYLLANRKAKRLAGLVRHYAGRTPCGSVQRSSYMRFGWTPRVRAASLARYGQLEVLRELTGLSWPRPAARLLLVPARQPGPAKWDRELLPLTSPASQSLWLPEPWISAQPAGRTLTR